MKKITIEKEEGIAELVDRMVGEEEEEITLVIPKGSALARSVRNFHLLKREADAAGKSVVIESVDETILAFAKESDIEASHPLWRGVRGAGGISDIVPASEMPEEKKAVGKRHKKKVEPVKLTVPDEEEEESEEDKEVEATLEVETEEEEEESFLSAKRFFGRRSAPPEFEEEEEEAPGYGARRRIVMWAAGVLVLILVGLGIATWVFGRAAITIDFQKTPWSYEKSFLADKSVSKINDVTNTIPAQVFTAQKNTTQLFPASGSANVSQKAQGTITIYNAYSSAKQDLVATTRFVTPDGKLFRLASSVTVPGATITNGQIVPSSIDAPVVADAAGPAYNVGATAKLTIPGFSGSPKYNAFYGQLKSGTSGGFTGTKAVPTAADITDAKTKVTAALQANLGSDLTTSYPKDFKILDGATNVQMAKLIVNTSTDANGKFSVFGEATLQAIGFDESALTAFLLSGAQSDGSQSVFDALSLNYSAVRADFTKGTVSFSLSANGTLKPPFSADDFRASVAGKSIGDARGAIAALPGLADGNISVWPRWLWNLPSDPNKISVSVQ